MTATAATDHYRPFRLVSFLRPLSYPFASIVLAGCKYSPHPLSVGDKWSTHWLIVGCKYGNAPET